MKGVAIIQTPTVWFGTFAVNLEVNDDWLHSPFAVPSETFPRPPSHLPHEEFPDTAAHRSRPEKLILAQTKEEQDRKSNKSHRSGRSRKTTVWKGQKKKKNEPKSKGFVLCCVALRVFVHSNLLQPCLWSRRGQIFRAEDLGTSWASEETRNNTGLGPGVHLSNKYSHLFHLRESECFQHHADVRGNDGGVERSSQLCGGCVGDYFHIIITLKTSPFICTDEGRSNWAQLPSSHNYCRPKELKKKKKVSRSLRKLSVVFVLKHTPPVKGLDTASQGSFFGCVQTVDWWPT